MHGVGHVSPQAQSPTMAEEGAALLQAIAELQAKENSKLHLLLLTLYIHTYIRAYIHTVNLLKYQNFKFLEDLQYRYTNIHTYVHTNIHTFHCSGECGWLRETRRVWYTVP